MSYGNGNVEGNKTVGNRSVRNRHRTTEIWRPGKRNMDLKYDASRMELEEKKLARCLKT